MPIEISVRAYDCAGTKSVEVLFSEEDKVFIEIGDESIELHRESAKAIAKEILKQIS